MSHRYISYQATVYLTAVNGNITTTGKFQPAHRVLELTDAQVELFAEAIDAAIEAGTLIEPRAQE